MRSKLYNRRQFLPLLLIIVIVVICGLSLPGIAQESLAQGLAPLNPNFLHYIENIKIDKVQKYTPTGYWLGYIPPPLGLSHMTGQTIFFKTL